jgi:hypothetical protein
MRLRLSSALSSRVRLSVVGITLGVIALGACSAQEPARDRGHAHEAEGAEPDPELGTVASALTATDPVSQAVTEACSTTAVKGLSKQLIDEVQCLRPGTFKSIEGLPGFTLGAAVFPFMQTPAADALVAAQKARGTRMTINSALRTLPQQYLLYRWYRTGRCGISLAAAPGRSNHESAVAVDIADNAGWRTAMSNNKYRWLGASDPVHYDYIGGGAVDIRGLSVRAFQRLWNRNNPQDRIAEDGDYGPATEARLAKSPVGGFAKGADCTQVGDAGVGADGGLDLPPYIPTEEPEGEEPEASPVAVPPAADEGGCAASGGGVPHAWAAPLGCALAWLWGVTRRRRGVSGPR